jgi:hypothetical protein
MLGTITELVGMGLMAWACWTEKVGNVYGLMALIGLGFGLRFMAVPLHGIGLFRQFRASVLALMALSIPLGGTLGLTIMSTVFNNTSGLDSHELGHNESGAQESSSADLPDDATYHAKVYHSQILNLALVTNEQARWALYGHLWLSSHSPSL